MIASVTLNPAVDYTVELPDPLADGAIARTDEYRYDAGGKGINVSKYLAALGVDTVATGLAGGRLGRFLRDELSTDGIATDFVEIEGETRLNTTVLTADGEYKINQNGPRVSGVAIETIGERLREYDPETVVIAGSRPKGVGPDAIDRLADAGPWETVVDVDGATLSALEGEYALCKPNLEELAAATDTRIDGVRDALAAADALRADGFERVVASLGDEGAVMATPERHLHAPARDVTVVDTVGAGDSLLAGVLAAHARGESAAQALRSGVAVSSHVVSVSGTQVPPLTDVSNERDAIAVSTY
ncbi:1-phosphofructokinase [Natrinema versiforme]|uniref:1-phosphofructokinase n=1 Tax=Natrinema versiforme JCM 10478 TaxID=1227496 RepID=L9XZY1_9EURY|nr:1-phosphofructokinase [Natrinema versiforme]ELY67414.1 1-phosphofructokinase [Natrinema versiforme JCM 10478]